MKFRFKKATTSVILTAFIQDTSKGDGSGLAGLDETSLITGGYLKRDSVGVALTCDENVTTEGTYQAPTTAGQVRIGTPANMPAGTYEFHFHNDLFTTKDWVTIALTGATNMAPILFEIQLLTNDHCDIMTRLGVPSGASVIQDIKDLLAVDTIATAAGGAAGAVKLSGASSVDNAYKDHLLFFRTGVNDGFARLITNYVGSTQVATVSPAFPNTPGTNDKGEVLIAGSKHLQALLAQPPQELPPAAQSLQAATLYAYKAWRNKSTQTETQYSLFADDASTIDHKATVSDDTTTTTKGEVATGP